MEYIHRLAWSRKHGPIPPGKKVLHKCDNPPCFEETHLFLGTQKDNMVDCANKGRTRRGERCSWAKLTSKDVLQMRCLRKIGLFQREIAKLFDVDRAHVSLVTRGKSWAHL